MTYRLGRQPIDLRSHRTRAAVEDADDLVAHGEDLERALRRVGLDRDAYDQHKLRARRRRTA